MVAATTMARPMRWFFVLVPLALAPACFAAGCGVEPVGLDSCRKIEDQRCEAAPGCAALKQPDVATCKRFYRDQCLHGLQVDTDPGGPVVDKCVAAIRAAGACAAGAPDAPCAAVQSSTSVSACKIIEAPELAADCAWLVPPAPAPTPAATDAGVDAADATSDGM